MRFPPDGHSRFISLFIVLLITPVPAFLRAQGPLPAATRIVLVGDSTVTDEAGWGAGFRQLVTDKVEVINESAGGRSSKSFIDEGRWTEALGKKGQYYLIQFGHNDEPGKGPERETDPATTFRTYMSRYVDEARAIGAKPILVTSLVRRIYNEDGSIRTTQTPYVEAVRALAKEKNVPLVDLHAISKDDAEQTGDDVWADLSPRDDKGQVDRTHLNGKGSAVVAQFVVDALQEVVPELRPYVKEQTLKPPARRLALAMPTFACTAGTPVRRCSTR
ncbi:MAG: rhamnogalacturonan acetylesterase [Vicinamibacterales bacterium]|jgi:pectinesterase